MPTRLVDLVPSIAASDPERLRELMSLLDAALGAVDPEEAVRGFLESEPPAGERITVVALGKAAPAMARGAAAALGGRVRRLVVVSDHTEPVPPGAELLVGSHPVPPRRAWKPAAVSSPQLRRRPITSCSWCREAGPLSPRFPAPA